MALDNKQAGEKWYAFELNNLMKQVRQLVLNIIDLSNFEDTIVASDVLRASADTERTTQSDIYLKVKEISIKRTGILRTKFSLKCAHASYGIKGRIYKNGVAFGTERSTNSTSYEEYSEDLAVTKNDLLQIYIKVNTLNENATAYIKNFRVYYSDSLAPVVNIN